MLFVNLYQCGKLHAAPTLLPGGVRDGIQMFAGSYEPMARTKYTNFFEYATLYPEYHFVFVGDNGQADVLTGEMMIRSFRSRISLVLIHLVQPIELTPGYTRQRYNEWYSIGIRFFRTYVGAGLEACLASIIHPRGLRRIMQRCVTEFFAIHKDFNALQHYSWYCTPYPPGVAPSSLGTEDVGSTVCDPTDINDMELENVVDLYSCTVVDDTVSSTLLKGNRMGSTITSGNATTITTSSNSNRSSNVNYRTNHHSTGNTDSGEQPARTELVHHGVQITYQIPNYTRTLLSKAYMMRENQRNA
uniref:Phosphatidate phosphatase APP1 catalytic domain-containing protein n=1 Tax=Lygus hesperus TaxID=30085 RepID=A0A0A9YAN8_LYGHE